MLDLFLSHLTNFFTNYNKCCSNLIKIDKNETIQCVDLDPPQLIKTISDFKDGENIIGFDYSQKDKFNDLINEAKTKIFGNARIDPNEIKKFEEKSKENRTCEETDKVHHLELPKKTRVIKFEE